MLLIILGTTLTISLISLVFINTSPQFGGKPSSESLIKITNSNNFKDGSFENLIPTAQSTGFKWRTIPQFFTNGNNKAPGSKLPQKKIATSYFKDTIRTPRVTWFGHSTVLVEMENKTIFIDPMLGDVPAPHPNLGSNRFNKELPISIDSLPEIDLVLISHDHYDHLDYGSIKKLKNRVKEFYVPLGIKAHLTSWGVNEEKITEFDWWDEKSFNNIKIAATPARHFSGRGFTRNNTLWTSWVLKSKNTTIYFSGDSGYGPHFKEIGEKFGPFDFAMMECGQYDDQWAQIHMNPEETIIASKDINANLVLPIHWGAFKLALHSWDDPVERAIVKAQELGVQITTPIIGESINLGNYSYPKSAWWKNIPKTIE